VVASAFNENAFSSGPSLMNTIEAHEIFEKGTSFKVTSVTVSAPAYSGRYGINVNMKGVKPRDFTFKQARLILIGDDLWNLLENTMGSLVISIFRSTLYPIVLVPHYMDSSKFERGSVAVDAKLTFGTGQTTKMKFNQNWFESKLNDVVQKGDPEFTLVVEYGDDEFGWSREGTLLQIETKASSFLKSIQTGESILNMSTKLK